MYAEVLIEIGRNPSARTFTYEVPEDWQTRIKVGQMLQVPIRNRFQTGILTALTHEKPSFETKRIQTMKEGPAVLSSWQFELAEWMSERYFASQFQCLKLMLPPRVRNPLKKIPEEIFYLRTETPLPDRLGKRELELNKKFEQKRIWARKEISEFSLQTLERWVEKKYLEKKIQNPKKSSLHPSSETRSPPELTPDQKAVLETLEKSNQKKFLLHGVTGSGKTEIYLQMAEKTLRKGQQAIILVPEVALTPQMVERFEARFPGQVEVLHSYRSEGERERAWWAIQSGEIPLVIGSRSALFAPLSKVGLIVLDEEHDGSYQQDQTPTYHAREVAEQRAKQSQATLILGSATPSIETRFAAENKTLVHLRLPHRIHTSERLPPVHLVDMREELRKKNLSIFSDHLMDRMTSTLEHNRQILLLLNRRGHASSVVCRGCGNVMRCPHCEISLTYHREAGYVERLRCHHCDWNQSMPPECPVCQSPAIKFIGLGTQKVEAELLKHFPRARIARADRDSMSRKDAFERLYEQMKRREIDILIGTQMIGKGLDLPHIGLVGVVLADIGLHRPDFRAGEQTFQLLTQVAGRTGRSEEGIGEVVIQTYNPDHPALRFAQRHDDDGFYQEELKNRQELNHPPFSEQIRLTALHEDQKICTNRVEALSTLLQTFNPSLRVNTAPAFIPKEKNLWVMHLFIEGAAPGESLKTLIKNHPLKGTWRIEVNPRD